MSKQNDGKILWQLLPVLLLYLWLGGVAWAQVDQWLSPTGETDTADAGYIEWLTSDACPGTAYRCNQSDCWTQVDESPATAANEDDRLITATGGQEQSWWRGQYATPTTCPDTSTNAQTVRIVVSECTQDCDETSNADAPIVNVVYECGGVLGTTIIGGATTVSQEDDEISSSFTFPGACDPDGSDFGIALLVDRDGNSKNFTSTCYESVEWGVAWGTCPSERRMWFVGDNDAMNGEAGRFVNEDLIFQASSYEKEKP